MRRNARPEENESPMRKNARLDEMNGQCNGTHGLIRIEADAKERKALEKNGTMGWRIG